MTVVLQMQSSAVTDIPSNSQVFLHIEQPILGHMTKNYPCGENIGFGQNLAKSPDLKCKTVVF